MWAVFRLSCGLVRLDIKARQKRQAVLSLGLTMRRTKVMPISSMRSFCLTSQDKFGVIGATVHNDLAPRLVVSSQPFRGKPRKSRAKDFEAKILEVQTLIAGPDE